MVTVRTIIALVITNNWVLFQLDINNVFLYGTLDESVCMFLPQGYHTKGDTRLWTLLKCLYGLKQSLRKWNEKL